MANKRGILLVGAMAIVVAAASSAAAQEASPAEPTAAAPASPPPAEPAAPATTAEPAAAAPAAPAAPAALPTGRVAPPPPGKGQVVFYRPSRLGGMALSFTVHEGDKGVGKLPNGTYFVLVADPGPHTFTVQSEATDTLNLEVEEGETTYVEQTIGMGIMVGRPHLTPADQATFDKLSLKLSTAKPTDKTPKASQ